MKFQLTKQTKIILFALTIALLGGVGYGGYRYWQSQQVVSESQEPAAVEEPKPTPITEPTADPNWNLYINKEYGFSVECPVGWKVEESLSSTRKDDESRVKSWVKFAKEDSAYINIFVRQSSKLDLLEWIKENRELVASDESVVPAKPNAKVAGLPAVVVYSQYTQAPTQVTTIFKGGAYIFRIAHFVPRDQTPLFWDKYEHCLKTFEFEGTEDIPDELPKFPMEF